MKRYTLLLALLIAGVEMFRALPARSGNTRAARVLSRVTSNSLSQDKENNR